MDRSETNWGVDVSEADFAEAVLDRSRRTPVVVDFWAPWCGPCRQLAPVLERLIAERNGEIILAKVNIDEAPHLAETYRVESIPSVIAFRDGHPALQFVGLLPEPQLRQFLDRVGPSPAEKLAKEAAEVEQTDPTRAEQLYRDALANDRNDDASALGLARILLAGGRTDEARGLLENVGTGGELGAEAARLTAGLFLRDHLQGLDDPKDEPALRSRLAAEPENADGRYRLGCVLAAAGKYEEALELLLSAAERDHKLATGPVKQVMVKTFDALGARHPVSDEYRRKLSMLLY